MPLYEIVRVFTVERTFAVEAPNKHYALAHPQDWEETGDEITQDVLSTEIYEVEDDNDDGMSQDANA